MAREVESDEGAILEDNSNTIEVSENRTFQEIGIISEGAEEARGGHREHWRDDEDRQRLCGEDAQGDTFSSFFLLHIASLHD